MAQAYVYVRFSSREQAKGDSARRQAAAAQSYTERCGDTLIELPIEDGVSAFTGANLHGVLGDFLDRLRNGQIPKGSKLLLEKFDRLSRQHHEAAHNTFSEIVRRGVTVVTLHNGKEYSSGMTILETMQALIEMDLAHQESLTKSRRVKESWERRRLDGGALTSVCPKWLRAAWLDGVEGGKRVRTTGLGDRGKFVERPDRVVLLRKIFGWLSTGMAPRTIATKLNRDGVPPWDGHRKAQGWYAGYISRMRSNRAVLGEMQPTQMVDGRRTPIGKPIKGYYPAVIEEDLWLAAQAAKRITGRPGRTPRFRNLLSGLVYSAIDGTRMAMKDTAVRSVKSGKLVHYTYLVSLKGRLKNQNTHSVRYEKLESDILFFLRWVAPDIIRAVGGDPIEDHKNDLADARALLAKSEKQLENLLDLAEKGVTPDLRERLIRRTKERDAHRQRLQELEEFKPQQRLTPLKLDDLDTVEGRRRTQVAIARVINRINVGKEGDEIVIYTRLFKNPVYFNPDEGSFSCADAQP